VAIQRILVVFTPENVTGKNALRVNVGAVFYNQENLDILTLLMEQCTSKVAKTKGVPFVIAGWRVDPASLRINNDKKTTKLEPKAMAVLDYLASRPGTVVSRQELEDSIWAGSIVGYDALSNAVIKLRKALGDKARKPHIIETIAKSGYRLIAEVDFEGQTDQVAEDDGLSKTSFSRKDGSTKRRISIVSIPAITFLLAVGIAFWWQPWLPEVEPASLDKMAFPLPDKPSIAVLPFTNISNDTEQDYFADGMTEDLITDISKLTGVFVIARNSVFNYKGKAVKIRQVAEDLGVRYVMEGSVQRENNQIRINAQLIDATTGGHVWAERYDGSLDDVFSMRDKITNKIVTALSIALVGQTQGMDQSETTDAEAYDAFLRGWGRYRQGTPEDYAKAVPHFEQAIKLDTDYARAYSALAAVYWNINLNGWSRSLGVLPFIIREKSRLALKEAMKNPSALTFQVASERDAYLQRKPDKALAKAEQAITLDGNDPVGHLAMATALLNASRANEAVQSVRTAMRLDPHNSSLYLTRLGQAQYAMGQYKKAAENLGISVSRNPDDDWAFVYLAAAYGQLGLEEAAAEALEKANKLRAKSGWGALTSEIIGLNNSYGPRRYYFKWFGDYKSLREGLRKAGVDWEASWRHLIVSGEAGPEVKGAATIDIDTAKSLHERGVVFIDVDIKWLKRRIPGTHYLSWWRFHFNEVLLPKIIGKNQEVVIYSSDERWASLAVAKAVSWGFEKVYFFPYGFDKWKKAGYPVETSKQ